MCMITLRAPLCQRTLSLRTRLSLSALGVNGTVFPPPFSFPTTRRTNSYISMLSSPFHFLFPPSVQLSFVESEFRAQLPQPFLKGRSASHVVRLNFNDENREERDRYTPLEDCDYLVDVDRTRTTALEPRYAADTAQWERVFAASFLDPEATPALHRALYLPFLRSQQARFVDYVLLKNKKRAL